ncbi:MAG TPA: hypothetical protein PKJ41_08850 [Bryobacteraceae bacterium]|nr:hypothetical protein [Bryobacteraceae bacterium]HPT28951.1 hypothetical protein [Bryobacteraceae bacterium]
MRLQLLALLPLALIGLAVMASAAEETVKGWLEVKGEKAALTHVFAISETDRLEPGDKEIVAVLLSTLPVPSELRKAGSDWTTWAGDEAVAGRMSGIVLMIDPKTKVWSRGQRLSKEHGLTFYSHTSTSAEGRVLRFEPAAAGPSEIAGKASMSEPMRGVDESDGPWRVEAEFRTTVVQQEAVTGRMKGAEALNSPQYKAVLAYLHACKRKDLEGIRKLMDAEWQKMLATLVEAQGRAEALEMLAAMAAESLTMKTVEVVVRGSMAEVKLMSVADGLRNEEALKVVLDGGVWKMTR